MVSLLPLPSSSLCFCSLLIVSLFTISSLTSLPLLFSFFPLPPLLSSPNISSKIKLGSEKESLWWYWPGPWWGESKHRFITRS